MAIITVLTSQDDFTELAKLFCDAFLGQALSWVLYIYEEDNIIMPFSQMKKLRHGQGRSLVLDTELEGH